MTPRVSVVMPVFNGGALLDPALDSLQRQSLRDIEIIVVDDGSTDDSVARIAARARDDGRIVLIQGQRQRISAALNRGIAAARGDLIARMDADDIAHSTRLDRQAEFLAAHDNVAVLGTGYRIIDADGRVLKTQTPATEPAAIRAILRDGNALAHPSVMMRRAAADLGYRELFPFAEDYDLWTRVAARWDIANLPDPLLDYRDTHRPFDAAYFEQQIVSSVAVAHAARRRAGGAADGFETPVTRAMLDTMGLGKNLTVALRRAAFGRARIFARGGRRDSQWAALAFAARHAPRGEGARAWVDYIGNMARGRAALLF